MPQTEAVQLSRSATELGLVETNELRPRVEARCEGVWVVHDVLSKAECDSIVSSGAALGMRQNGTGRFRDCTRAIFFAPEASKLVFSRLKHLPLFGDQLEVLPSDKTVHQPPLQGVAGTWQPYGINECWRLCQYKPGGHFAPHFDDEFKRGDGDRSLRTFMLYLNDVPAAAGGATNIVTDAGTPEWCAAEGRLVRSSKSAVLAAVQPRAGSAIVFNHRIMHEGERLTEGTKWILRTEVMFKQTAQEPPLRLTDADFEGQRLYEEGTSLLEAAAKLGPGASAESARLHMEAATLFSRVRKLAPRVADAHRL